MTELRRYPDKLSMARAAAEYFVSVAQAAIAADDRFTVALAGGSTPRTMYEIIAEDLLTQVDWSKVHIFWGDERSVPPDRADSNYRMANESLIKRVGVPSEQIHRIHADLDPADAAEQYVAVLGNVFGEDTVPQFDLILLGMGGDGHTASLFPGTAALDIEDQWFVANYVPKLDTWRLTLTKTVINAASNVAFLVAGSDKSAALLEVINGPYLPDTYPSQLIEPEDGQLIWFVDDAAAELI